MTDSWKGQERRRQGGDSAVPRASVGTRSAWAPRRLTDQRQVSLQPLRICIFLFFFF